MSSGSGPVKEFDAVALLYEIGSLSPSVPFETGLVGEGVTLQQGQIRDKLK